LAENGGKTTIATFFATPAEWRAWLEQHHEHEREFWVGFYKKASGRPSITWPEAVDQALCFGWIDGVRKSIDDVSYMNRFTPRKSRSTWSAVNVARVEELTRLGLMRPAGLAAFAARSDQKTAIYAYEQENPLLDAEFEQTFRTNDRAWRFFNAQAPWYQRTATWWVMSAKREETRRKRLATLIEESDQGRRVAQLSRPTKD
jgi:uncharacterized protein YdeI (YjbR/CyaY-like superfamily)